MQWMQCQRLAYQGSRGAIAAPRWCQIDRRLGACSLNAMQGCWGGKEVEGSREATLVQLSDECGFYAVKCFGSVENWEACSEAGKDFRDTQRGPSTSELEALHSLCVWFFILRSICHAECSITGETLLGAGGIRKKFGPFEMKSINWAVVQRLPSVMPMSMHWALVLMSLRMQHLAGVASWTRCPYRCLVASPDSYFVWIWDMIDVTCNCWKICVVYVCMNDTTSECCKLAKWFAFAGTWSCQSQS